MKEVEMYKDLRDYLNELENRGQLLKIEKEVEDGEEIFTIMWKLSEQGKNDPAVIFQNVKGYSVPIVCNILGSDPQRWPLALSLEDNMDVRALRDFIVTKVQSKNEWKLARSVTHTEASVKEIILQNDEIDLYEFPILQWHPLDMGRYITYGLSITNDKDYGINMGIYRIMILDHKRVTIMCSPYQHIGIHLDKARQDGKKYLECAIAIGNSPSLIVAGFTKMGVRDSEIDFASVLNGGEPIDMVKCETVDLEVPANSEIVLEGRISTEHYVPEGTFGEYMGYHEEQMEYPVFEISCISHRKDPIYLNTIVSHPRADGEALFRSVVQNAHFYQELQKANIPGFVDAWLPLYGHGFMGIISVKKRYPGWGRQLLYRILGIPFIAATMNCIVLVDEDIDPSNWEHIIWVMSTRVDPERDVVITKPMAMYGLNPAASERLKPKNAATEISFLSRMLIDATLKSEEDGLKREPPIPVKPRKEVLEKVEALWKEYGFKEID